MKKMKETAETLGIKVYSYDIAPMYGCFFSVNGNHVIGVDSSLPEPIQDFVIAHEMYHFREGSAIALKANLISTDEIEADRYALWHIITAELVAEHPTFMLSEWETFTGLPAELIRLRFE